MPASSIPLNAADSLLVPVWIRQGIAPNGLRRPHPSRIYRPHQLWSGAWPPTDGWYDVPTTWRQILDAAATVGRDPAPWLSSLPILAANELLARLAPLAAYLHHDGATSPALLCPSPVYSFGAEKSAQGAMAYRLGMTMTEWVAKTLIGLPATTHHEDAAPTGAGPDWFGPGKRPDLWSEDLNVTPTVWCLEAKAGRRLNQGTLKKGAAQLAALGPTVLPVQHDAGSY